MSDLVVIESFDFLGLDVDVYVDETNTYWFHGATICECLGLTNTAVTISRKVDDQWKRKFPFGRGLDSWFVQEPGIYQLAFASSSALAIKFQTWVFSEVLPSIRKKGGYISQSITQDQAIAIKEELETKITQLEEQNNALKKELGTMERQKKIEDDFLQTDLVFASADDIMDVFHKKYALRLYSSPMHSLQKALTQKYIDYLKTRGATNPKPKDAMTLPLVDIGVTTMEFLMLMRESFKGYYYEHTDVRYPLDKISECYALPSLEMPAEQNNKFRKSL
jgi:prophage antirepressor-like protein